MHMYICTYTFNIYIYMCTASKAISASNFIVAPCNSILYHYIETCSILQLRCPNFSKQFSQLRTCHLCTVPTILANHLLATSNFVNDPLVIIYSHGKLSNCR